MKTAYELAMERLNRQAPAPKLTEVQKEALAELDSKYRAKIAEREIFLEGRLAEARAAGDYEALGQIEQQLASERKVLAAELEEKKERVRRGSEPAGGQDDPVSPGKRPLRKSS
jgi:hypothetical protein